MYTSLVHIVVQRVRLCTCERPFILKPLYASAVVNRPCPIVIVRLAVGVCDYNVLVVVSAVKGYSAENSC